MGMLNISWIFIFVSSSYAIVLPLLHPMSGLKSEELSPSKVIPRSITAKLSFTTLPKLADPIDEGENFWINPRREKKRHYESVKIGQSSKNPEGVSNLIDNMINNQPSVMNSQINSNLEGLSSWFGFPKDSIGSKRVKPTERIINLKSFDTESKTVSKLPSPDMKSGPNVNKSADKNTNSEKDANTEKIPNVEKTPEKLDLDISDLLILDALSEKLEDFSEEKIKDESEKQTIASLPVIQPPGFFHQPQKRKMFSPILSSAFDVLRPYERSGFLFHNPGQRHNFDINREKDLEVEKNEIKINPKESSSFVDKSPILVYNNLKKLPLQLSSQQHETLFKSEGPIEVQNLPVLNNLSEPAFTLTKISMTPAQGSIEDLGSFLESLNLRGRDEHRTVNTNFRSVKPLSKKETSSPKPESLFHQNNLDPDSKKIRSLNSVSMKGNMMFDIVLVPNVQVSKEKEETKNKKEVVKLSKPNFKEFFKKSMNEYPKLYQFLEKFSEKIIESALKYEIAGRYVNLLETSYRTVTPQANNSSNLSQL